MTTIKLKVSLTRAHKLAERISALIAEQVAQAQQFAAPSSVDGILGDGVAQVEALERRGVTAMAAVAVVEQLYKDWEAARTAIAEANVSAGVSAKLAHQEVLKRKASLLRQLVDAGKREGLAPRDIAAFRSLAPSTSYGVRGLFAKALTDAQLAELEEKLANVQRELFVLSDEISDANTTKIEISISQWAASKVTGE